MDNLGCGVVAMVVLICMTISMLILLWLGWDKLMLEPTWKIAGCMIGAVGMPWLVGRLALAFIDPERFPLD